MTAVKDPVPVATLRVVSDYSAFEGRKRIEVIARDLEAMAHALAGEVEPALVAQFVVLCARLDKRLEDTNAAA